MDADHPSDGVLIPLRSTETDDIAARQAHLSLRWETRWLWPRIADLTGRSGKTKGEQTAAVLLALYVEACAGNRWISYSRAKTHYDRPARYRTPLYTYRGVVGSVDRLEVLGLIDHDKAPPGRLGWQSAMRARSELIGVLDDVIRSGEMRLARLREPLLLRDADRNLLDYRETRETCRIRTELHEQNEAIAAADFGTILSFPGRLRRIFNADFAHGGRFYAEGGSWQTLPKADRQRMEIDGEPVVEIDFAAFHPALAYAECGLKPHPAPYSVPGFPRPLVKIAFNVLLNSKKRNGARHELAHKPEMAAHLLGLDLDRVDDPERLPWDIATHRPEYFQRSSREAERLIEALLDLHRPIGRLFFTGAGLRFQRKDSDIAEGVMRVMRRRGVLVLPVHDSFLAPASKADLLEQIMTDEAARRGVSVLCKCSSSIPKG